MICNLNISSSLYLFCRSLIIIITFTPKTNSIDTAGIIFNLAFWKCCSRANNWLMANQLNYNYNNEDEYYNYVVQSVYNFNNNYKNIILI